VIFEGPLTIEKWEKHCKTNVSKGKSLSVHNPSGSAAPSKLFLHFWTKAVRNAGFQRNFGFGLWWLHFFRLRCLLVQSKSSMNLSSWISDP
jgi:hypothetical protein